MRWTPRHTAAIALPSLLAGAIVASQWAGLSGTTTTELPKASECSSFETIDGIANACRSSEGIVLALESGETTLMHGDPRPSDDVEVAHEAFRSRIMHQITAFSRSAPADPAAAPLGDSADRLDAAIQAGDVTAASTRAPHLTATQRTSAVQCAPSGSYRISVLYVLPAELEETPQNPSPFDERTATRIKDEVAVASAFVDRSARARGGRAQLRVECSRDATGTPDIVVHKLRLSRTIAEMANKPERYIDELRGFRSYDEKTRYIVYLGRPDFPGCRNNYGVAWPHPLLGWNHFAFQCGRLPSYSIMLHELTHIIGLAVDKSAPDGDAKGHSSIRGDIVSSPTPTKTCGAPPTYDCGGDSYFNPYPRPRKWLDMHPARNVATSRYLATHLDRTQVVSCTARPEQTTCRGSSDSEQIKVWDEGRPRGWTVAAGSGYDEIRIFGSLPTIAYGESGNDTMIGGPANDNLIGGPGIDTIEGRGGTDIYSGGDGDDRIDSSHGSEYEIVNCGSGMDTVLYDGDGGIMGHGERKDKLIGCEFPLEEQGNGTFKLNCALSSLSPELCRRNY